MTSANTSDLQKPAWIEKAAILTESLPYMKRFAERSFVIKYGGHAMGDDRLKAIFAQDVALLKQIGINPVVVHGGGPQIGKMLKRLNVGTEFIDGLRVTDAATVEVVEMVLAGTVNKEIVTAINRAGGTAVGICGKDGELIRARKLRRTVKDPDSNIEKALDLGFVGEPSFVNPHILSALKASGLIPVVAPIGVGDNGETYNINGDTAAGAIASALGATRFMLLTDVPGVLDKNKELITELTPEKARALIADGTITGGMIPKVETCIDAVESGVDGAVILDGRQEHAVLVEIFTEGGAGTLFKKG